jgi:hypothetical protein
MFCSQGDAMRILKRLAGRVPHIMPLAILLPIVLFSSNLSGQTTGDNSRKGFGSNWSSCGNETVTAQNVGTGYVQEALSNSEGVRYTLPPDQRVQDHRA